jgi:hypothetical protein
MNMEKLKTTIDQILGRLPSVRGRGEEATKQALILPMLDALGYDIWNPSEVCPEYDADFAVKKLGQKEKVDFAVLLNGSPRIYVEVKAVDSPLDGHQGQLARYFNATQSVSLAILTNGIEYWLFTDTGDPNVLDPAPFFVIKLDAIDQGLEVLARFHKSVFSPEAIREYATELNYTAKMVDFLRRELDLRERDPSEEFIRWILGSERMYSSRITANVVERFCPIGKTALQIVLRDIVRRSVAALDKEVTAPSRSVLDAAVEAAIEPMPSSENGDTSDDGKDGPKQRIVTTERELDCFAEVKALFDISALAKGTILDVSTRKEVPIQLSYKDTTGYFGIYLNKPSWWALRINIECRSPWVGFNIDPAVGCTLLPPSCTRLAPNPYAEFRVAISSPQDLNALSRLIHSSFQKIVDDRRAPKETEGSLGKATVVAT